MDHIITQADREWKNFLWRINDPGQEAKLVRCARLPSAVSEKFETKIKLAWLLYGTVHYIADA
jgi:hypothetical protein